MTVVALDVGTRRIGVAVSDPFDSFALPLKVIERSNTREDIRRVIETLREYECTELVIGDPLTLLGERGPAADKIDTFVAALQRLFPGTVHRIDERLTTAAATRTLLEADVSRTRRKRVVDKLAAALILDTFLAMRRSGKSP